MKPENARSVFFAVTAAKSNVDVAAGRLNGVVLMLSDREASGHGLWIDAATLESALAAAPESRRILAYIHHPTMSDEVVGNGADRWDKAAGYFENLRIEDAALKGDFVAYDAWRTDDKSLFARLFEMAAKTPELVNISIEGCGYCVFVGADGNEYSIPPAGAEMVRDIPSFRITDLSAAAFVADGAATESLFGSLRKFFAKVKAKLTVEPAAPSAAPATPAAPAPAAASVSGAPIAVIAEKFSADAPRLARAIALSRENAALTLAEIETVLLSEDRIAEIAQLTTLSSNQASQIVALNKQLVDANASLEAARKAAAGWETKFNELRNSGHDSPVNLGAPGAQVTQSEQALVARYMSIKDPTARGEFYSKFIAPLRK